MATDSEGRTEEPGSRGPVRPPVGDPSAAAGSGRPGADAGADDRPGSAKGAGSEAGTPGGGVEDDDHSGTRPLGEGIRQGLGVLSAFRDALEETIQEARDRGELSTDRAREMMREALQRAREAAGEARGRLDFAPQEELDALRREVDELRVRVERLEARSDASGGGAGGAASGGGEAPPSP